MLVGDRPQFPEHRYRYVQYIAGPAQNTGWVFAPKTPDLLFALDRGDGELVKAHGDRWVLEAVLQSVLPVQDRGQIVIAPGQDRDFRHLEQELVACRHGTEQRVQLQILGQRLLVPRQLALQVEV